MKTTLLLAIHAISSMLFSTVDANNFLVNIKLPAKSYQTANFHNTALTINKEIIPKITNNLATPHTLKLICEVNPLIDKIETQIQEVENINAKLKIRDIPYLPDDHKISINSVGDTEYMENPDPEVIYDVIDNYFDKLSKLAVYSYTRGVSLFLLETKILKIDDTMMPVIVVNEESKYYNIPTNSDNLELKKYL
jgi:hypothetical protein